MVGRLYGPIDLQWSAGDGATGQPSQCCVARAVLAWIISPDPAGVTWRGAKPKLKRKACHHVSCTAGVDVRTLAKATAATGEAFFATSVDMERRSEVPSGRAAFARIRLKPRIAIALKGGSLARLGLRSQGDVDEGTLSSADVSICLVPDTFLFLGVWGFIFGADEPGPVNLDRYTMCAAIGKSMPEVIQRP